MRLPSVVTQANCFHWDLQRRTKVPGIILLLEMLSAWPNIARRALWSLCSVKHARLHQNLETVGEDKDSRSSANHQIQSVSWFCGLQFLWAPSAYTTTIKVDRKLLILPARKSQVYFCERSVVDTQALSLLVRDWTHSIKRWETYETWCQ